MGEHGECLEVPGRNLSVDTYFVFLDYCFRSRNQIIVSESVEYLVGVYKNTANALSSAENVEGEVGRKGVHCHKQNLFNQSLSAT